MVSLQSALSPEAKRPCLPVEKKRKRDDGDGEGEDPAGEGIELSFDTAPLPAEWQRCLDIKSGQIHYYNTRTHKRTWKDPRGDPSPVGAADCPPSLDLELNLAFEPRRVQEKKARPEAKPEPEADRAEPEAEAEMGTSKEMVAAVCMRCHMLVMMCRECPACPNCKFMHPPSRAAVEPPAPAPPKLGFQLLCCKD